jgi:hypothetical protein
LFIHVLLSTLHAEHFEEALPNVDHMAFITSNLNEVEKQLREHNVFYKRVRVLSCLAWPGLALPCLACAGVESVLGPRIRPTDLSPITNTNTTSRSLS